MNEGKGEESKLSKTAKMQLKGISVTSMALDALKHTLGTLITHVMQYFSKLQAS